MFIVNNVLKLAEKPKLTNFPLFLLEDRITFLAHCIASLSHRGNLFGDWINALLLLSIPFFRSLVLFEVIYFNLKKSI